MDGIEGIGSVADAFVEAAAAEASSEDSTSSTVGSLAEGAEPAIVKLGMKENVVEIALSSDAEAVGFASWCTGGAAEPVG